MKFIKMKVLDEITAKSIISYSSSGILKRPVFNKQRKKEALSPVIIRVCTTEPKTQTTTPTTTMMTGARLRSPLVIEKAASVTGYCYTEATLHALAVVCSPRISFVPRRSSNACYSRHLAKFFCE